MMLWALQLLFRYYKATQAGVAMEQINSQSYEMNLVFRNIQPPRLNLAVHSDWRWMRTGRQIDWASSLIFPL